MLANVTGWHKMTFIGIISVAANFVLSELLMKGVRKHRPALIYPWIAAVAIQVGGKIHQ